MNSRHNYFITACKMNDLGTVKRYQEAYRGKPETRQKYGQMGLFPIHIAAMNGADSVFHELVKTCIKQVTLQAVPLRLSRLEETVIVPARSTVLPFLLYGGSVEMLRAIERSVFVKTYKYDRYYMSAIFQIAQNASQAVREWYEWFSSGGAKEHVNSSGCLTSYASTVFETLVR